MNGIKMLKKVRNPKIVQDISDKPKWKMISELTRKKSKQEDNKVDRKDQRDYKRDTE